jgi:hypothetical protein
MTGPLLWASRFEIVKRSKMALSQWRRRDILLTDGQRGGDSTTTTSVAELTWPVIDKIVNLCGEQGAVTVLGWSSGGSPSYDWLQAKTAAEGLAFADWWPSVESVQQSVGEISLANPHSGGHWRTWINRLIADAFAREIERLESGNGNGVP